MRSVHATTEAAIARSKAAIPVAEAAFATVSTPPTTTRSMSPGQILAAMTKAGDCSPRALSRRSVEIRRHLTSEQKAARADVESARREAIAWADVADYLAGKSQAIPVGLPDHIIKAAALVKSAQQAGIVTLQIAPEIERAAQAALITVGQASSTLDRVESAGKIASAASAERMFQRALGMPGYSSADRVKIDRSHRAFKQVTAKMKTVHAMKYFDAMQQRRTYGHNLAESIGGAK